MYEYSTVSKNRRRVFTLVLLVVHYPLVRKTRHMSDVSLCGSSARINNRQNT